MEPIVKIWQLILISFQNLVKLSSFIKHKKKPFVCVENPIDLVEKKNENLHP
jgi:hypothetical protein